MNIAFDSSPLMDPEKTGIGFYAAGFAKNIIRRHPENNYYLPFFCLRKESEKKELLQDYCAPQVQLQPCRWFSGSLYKKLWTFFPIPQQLFFGRKADITHFFNFLVPPGVHGKKVTTVHDMVYKAFPETVRFKTKIMLDLNLKASCKRADKIITISEFSKKELLRYFSIPSDKIVVIPIGVDRTVFHPNQSPEKIEQAKTQYGISGNYFLYLGTLEPRKNLVRLIEAYARLYKKCPECPVLVLAGRKGWMYDDIFAKVRELNLTNQVIFTGYVQNSDPPLLLAGSIAFLFPSLYEGFGMPPLEAMACGTPVLTSNTASLPEVVGDAAILVNPYSIDDICNGMFRLATDEALRQTYQEKGLQQASQFTWEATSEMLYAVYETLMKE